MRPGLNRRRFLALSAGAGLAGWLSEPPYPARAQGPTLLNVGLGFHDLEAAAAWIAQEKRFFQKYGLDVTIVNFQGGARSMAALVSGDVPIGLNSGASVVAARSRGFPIVMIAGIVNRFTFDLVVAKNITSPAQLKGTKGAISSFGGSSDFAARFAISKLGLKPTDVTLLTVGNETSRLAALESGQIQFTVLTAGLDLAAFNMGYKPMLKLYELDQPYQDSGIAVNVDWAKAHPVIVESFLKAIIEANVYMKNPLNIAAVLALLHKYLPINESELKQGFRFYRDQFYQIYPFVTLAGLELILKERKINLPVTEFYDSSYLQALQKANFAATVQQSP